MKKQSLLIAVLLSLFAVAHAQKKKLTHDVYDSWQQVANLQLSSRGAFSVFEENPQEGDGTLVVVSNSTGKKLTIPRGYGANITPDEQFLICLIKPFFADTRQAKIAKKKQNQMPKDSLAVVSLKTFSVEKFPQIVSYRIPQNGSSTLAMLSADTLLLPPADRKKTDNGHSLLVKFLQSKQERIDTVFCVEQYRFSPDGQTLAVVAKTGQKSKAEQRQVKWLDLQSKKNVFASPAIAFGTLPSFSEQGDALLFLSSADTLETGSKKCRLMLVQQKEGKGEELAVTGRGTLFPEGWGINEHANPFFSKNGDKIFFGVSPIVPPKDTSIVAFEVADLDIWNYQDLELPPMQQANLSSFPKQQVLYAVDRGTKNIVPLSASLYEKVQLSQDAQGAWALVTDQTQYTYDMQWDIQAPISLSLVNVSTGERRAIAKGKFTSAHLSPNGLYVAWFDLVSAEWTVYDVTQAKLLSVGKPSADVVFADEDDDMPWLSPPYGYAGWTEGDQAFVVYDRFDLWSISPQQSKWTNLTQAYGQKNNLKLRQLFAPERPRANVSVQNRVYLSQAISTKTPLILSAYDYASKKNGFVELKWNRKNGVKELYLGGYTFGSIKKATNADVVVYTKGNFSTTPNAFVTNNWWHKETQLSNINKQMKDYLWGTVELFNWNAFDGTPLQGLLYKPENFDPSGSYPTIVYFYERYSDRLYQHYSPAPSASIVNIPLYVSRGYVVFVPDIVYKDGYPGESSYNCVVSGAQAVAQLPGIDSTRMAIQGQSWGGYQVSYLITRTNMFKCAEAGAPVSNMTSAYGGIRWTTGMSRQFQYEQSQSRIGKTLWEDIPLYLANSPLFAADKVQTPLLIMHNDNDGAVPWYQGIEYFMALRRLGKPVWMLQYNKEEHNLMQRRNRKDLSVRMLQFFDYYLQDAPMPAWMKQGIPAWKKGQYFATEYVE